jgi:hypothetical protein
MPRYERESEIRNSLATTMVRTKSILDLYRYAFVDTRSECTRYLLPSVVLVGPPSGS